METAQRINTVFSALGTLIFAALFFYVTLSPDDFDRRAQGFVVARVQDMADRELQRIAQLETAETVSRIAGVLSPRLQQRIDQARSSLASGSSRFVRDVLAAACKVNCDRQQQAAAAVRTFYERAIARYGIALGSLQSMIVSRYEAVMGELRGDLRIFAFSNAIAFMCALGLTLFRKRAARHLLPISLALGGATLFAIVWYLFNQDWMTAIIFSDYWGWSYAAMLLVVVLLMADIAANRARVTSSILNGIGGVFGESVSYLPC